MLDSDSNTWFWVYHFDFEKTVVGKGVVFFVQAFDPNDGNNVVYLVREEHIYIGTRYCKTSTTSLASLGPFVVPKKKSTTRFVSFHVMMITINLFIERGRE